MRRRGRATRPPLNAHRRDACATNSSKLFKALISGDIPSLDRPVIDEVGCEALGAAAARGINEDEEFQLILDYAAEKCRK